MMVGVGRVIWVPLAGSYLFRANLVLLLVAQTLPSSSEGTTSVPTPALVIESSQKFIVHRAFAAAASFRPFMVPGRLTSVTISRTSSRSSSNCRFVGARRGQHLVTGLLKNEFQMLVGQ